jgi:hypothetical protein
MPHRSKQEAELRLKMAMAQAMMRQGKSDRDMLEAFRDHQTIVSELERSQRLSTETIYDAADEKRATKFS